MEHVVQRISGCLIPYSLQGQVGQGLEKPGVVYDIPTHGRGLESHDL